jgi:hypothetical protein
MRFADTVHSEQWFNTDEQYLTCRTHLTNHCSTLTGPLPSPSSPGGQNALLNVGLSVFCETETETETETEKRETAARVRVRSSCEGRKLRLAAPSLPRVDRRRRGRDGGGSRGPGRRGHQLPQEAAQLPGARGAGQDRYAPVDLEGTWVSQRGLRVVRRGRGSGFRGSYIGRAW